MDVLTKQLEKLNKEKEALEKAIEEKLENDNKQNASISTIEELLKEQNSYFNTSILGRPNEKIFTDPDTNIKLITIRDKLENMYMKTFTTGVAGQAFSNALRPARKDCLKRQSRVQLLTLQP